MHHDSTLPCSVLQAACSLCTSLDTAVVCQLVMTRLLFDTVSHLKPVFGASGSSKQLVFANFPRTILDATGTGCERIRGSNFREFLLINAR